MADDKPKADMRQTIEYFKSDRKWLDDYDEDIRILAGIIIEALKDNRGMLLSDHWRTMVLRHAQLVEKKRERLAGFKLYVDNLTRPLDDSGDKS